MSHSQFHSIDLFILRHAWLNLWDKRMLLAESTRLLSRGSSVGTNPNQIRIQSQKGLRPSCCGTFLCFWRCLRESHSSFGSELAAFADKLSLAESFINPKARRRYHALSAGGFYSSTHSNRNRSLVQITENNCRHKHGIRTEASLAWPSYSSVISTSNAASQASRINALWSNKWFLMYTFVQLLRR